MAISVDVCTPMAAPGCDHGTPGKGKPWLRLELPVYAGDDELCAWSPASSPSPVSRSLLPRLGAQEGCREGISAYLEQCEAEMGATAWAEGCAPPLTPPAGPAALKSTHGHARKPAGQPASKGCDVLLHTMPVSPAFYLLGIYE